MITKIIRLALVHALTLTLFASIATAGPKTDDENEGKKEEKSKQKTIAEVAEASELIDGMFPLYQDKKNGDVYMLIRKDQLDKEYIYFSYTTDGVVESRHFRGQIRTNSVFSLKRYFDKIEFIKHNTGFYFPEDSPLKRAENANISPAVLAVEKIVNAEEAGDKYLIKLNKVFLTESFVQMKGPPDPEAKPGKKFGLGKLSKDKSRFVELRNYPENTEIVVSYVYENDAPVDANGREVTDSRYVTVTVQHSMLKMPENSFQSRFADARLGYFLEKANDMASVEVTPYHDLINRWDLKKKDPSMAVSDPITPIVFWIENTTPIELRDTIKTAALSWNIAFETAGISNALQVKIQPDDATWDAGDIRYNVLRWTSSPNPPFGGYGPNFTNPRTGQILGADIMLEFSVVGRRLMAGSVFETAALTDGGVDLISEQGQYCQLGSMMQRDRMFGALALAAGVGWKIDDSKLLREFIAYLVIHEIGHTLGLNHNMRATQLHALDTVHDEAITASMGLVGSVMDYPAINVAGPGRKQGQFYTTRPGPYDLWAIEYGYSAALADADAEAQRLENILRRSTQPELAFGNDADDMRSPGRGIDPRVMIGDMSSDAVEYAAERLALVKQLLPKVVDLVASPGDSYQAVRNAYLILTREQRNATRVLSRYVGGVYLDRAVQGQAGATIPFRPVPKKEQQRAMALLAEYLFAPSAFEAPAGLYARLQTQRRDFEFFGRTEDPKIHARALMVQKGVLDHLLHKVVLERLSDTRLYGNGYAMSEMLDDLTSAVFDADLRGNVNDFRQNLQSEYVGRLVNIMNARGKKSSYGFTVRSQAHANLLRIQKMMKKARSGDKATQAHRGYVQFVIEAGLSPDKNS